MQFWYTGYILVVSKFKYIQALYTLEAKLTKYCFFLAVVVSSIVIDLRKFNICIAL